MKYKLPAILFFLVVFSSCSKDDTEVFEEFNTKTNYQLEFQNSIPEATYLNIAYGAHEQQVFDIYLPEGRTNLKTKVIIIIHGGGWINGDKSAFTDFAIQLKENNPDHAIVNINYVLGNENHFAFPNQFFDINKVINFLKKNKNEYHINPEFGLIGSSAGGHLALHYSYKYNTFNDVKFVVSLGGPTNFLDHHYQDQREELFNSLVDQDYYQENSLIAQSINEVNITSVLKKLSPIFQVNKKSSPTLLIYGNQDQLVPISNATYLSNYLINHNIEYNLEVFEGGHGAWYSEDQIDTTHMLINDFIVNHLP